MKDNQAKPCAIRGFILMKYLKDISICDDLINFYKNSDEKGQGKMIMNNVAGYYPDRKDSTDCVLRDPLLDKYLNSLQNVIGTYMEKFPMSKSEAAWGIVENVNIQHYKPNQGFKSWHTERSCANNNRHLVFMTYLNDVMDGGETEWFHQKGRVKPRKGLTVIWPSDWTHMHRGVVSKTEHKYIVTGWIEYLP